MTESEFLVLADAMLEQIETALDEQDVDCDINSTGGVMELTFEGGAKVIVNRHAPNREIWVAARSGGFHYKYSSNKWVNTRDGGDLNKQLAAIITAHADAPFKLD